MDDNPRGAVHTAAMASALVIRSALAMALSAVAFGLVSLPLAAGAQLIVEKSARAEEATSACERKVRQSLSAQVANPEVTFNAAPAVQPSLSGDGQVVLQGEGRWRAADGARRFNYSCNVDVRTAEVFGLVMRDSRPAAAPPPPAPRPAEPDLSHLSLAACESSVVQALKQRWPLVSQISFDSDTRSYGQETSIRAELHGRGRALPAQGAPSTLFGFDCAIDPRDGQVLGTRLTG